MKLRDLAVGYGKVIDKDSCPIHILNELGENTLEKIDDKYKIGERLIPYCKKDNCWECWDMKLWRTSNISWNKGKGRCIKMPIDMVNYKMIYQDQVFNVLSIILTFGDFTEGNPPKPKFIDATFIDENGEIKTLRDEAWCFKFIRR